MTWFTDCASGTKVITTKGLMKHWTCGLRLLSISSDSLPHTCACTHKTACPSTWLAKNWRYGTCESFVQKCLDSLGTSGTSIPKIGIQSIVVRCSGWTNTLRKRSFRIKSYWLLHCYTSQFHLAWSKCSRCCRISQTRNQPIWRLESCLISCSKLKPHSRLIMQWAIQNGQSQKRKRNSTLQLKKCTYQTKSTENEI